MNEPLLKATLKVILDGQATLYAMIQTNSMGMNYDPSADSYQNFVDEFKKETAVLILEALNEAQDNTG